MACISLKMTHLWYKIIYTTDAPFSVELQAIEYCVEFSMDFDTQYLMDPIMKRQLSFMILMPPVV